MRSKNFYKIRKIASRPKNTKKTLIRTTANYAQNVSKIDLDKMNEILRIRKSERENNKYGWKLVPKDSCEVYKDRHKKNKSKVPTQEGDNEAVKATEKRDTKKTLCKPKKKRKEVKIRQTRRKPKQRRYTNSSTSSYTASTVSSCNTSDMDYN